MKYENRMNNIKKKKILVLSTGGTIASTKSIDGLIPSVKGAGLFDEIPGLTLNYEIEVRDILHLDSSNIQPEEWILIGQEVYKAYESCDGIVITHGTDTMAYTASILTFMLVNPPIPIVLTGSQLPLFHQLTDAIDNLRSAFAMAASEVPGIFVAFDRKIILGCRSVKIRTTGFDAFESVNYPYIAKVDSNGLNIDRRRLHETIGEPSFSCSLCPDVFLIKLTPGLNPEIFDMLLQLRYKGIVIEAFGAGGMHFIHRDLISKIAKLSEKGIPVVINSQCLYEKSDLSVYQVGQMALKEGVISALDMTTEATVTKLIWALGQTNNMEEIRKIFATNYGGEISL